MQLIFNFAFALSVIATATAELEFRPHEGNNARRALFRGNDLKGCWGNFHQDGFCVEKIVDPDDTGSDKVKMTPCDGTNPAQMWKFDKNDENAGDFLPHYGLVYNMEGGCLGIRGSVVAGKNVKVFECDRNNPKQHWKSDGDSVAPRDYKDLCLNPAGRQRLDDDGDDDYTVENKDPVAVVDCEDTNSLDYFAPLNR